MTPSESSKSGSARYEIREKIGTGGAGTVYKAWDTQLHRNVAFKRLNPTDSPDETNVDQMWKEAMTLAAFQHPNILTLFDCGVDDEGPFVVTEFLDGVTLDKHVQAEGVYTVRAFTEVVNQTLEGLIAAHHAGVIHRDIKHYNIMVVRLPSGALQYKILDFGLAKFATQPTAQTMQGDKSIYGTVYFLAPEQLSRQPLDSRTDLYAMGCVYYFMLSGQHAFNGESFAEVIGNHLQHTVVPLHDLRPDLPKSLCDWVMKLMSCNPDDRPESAAAALEDFRRVAAFKKAYTTIKITSQDVGSAPTARIAAKRAPASSPPPPPKKRWPLVAAGGGGIAILAVALLFFGVGKRPDTGSVSDPATISEMFAAPQFTGEIREELLQSYFNQIKDLTFDYGRVGSVGEALALLELIRDYPPPDYEILHGIQYFRPDGSAGGELDVVLWERASNRAILIGEVKLSANLKSAASKGRSQLRRFQQSLLAGQIFGFTYPDDPSRPFSADQFKDVERFIVFGSQGAIEAGCDIELDITREEANRLQNALQRYRGKGRSSRLHDFLRALRRAA